MNLSILYSTPDSPRTAAATKVVLMLPIGADRSVEMVGSFAPAAARDVLGNNHRIARNILAQNRREDLHPHIHRSAGIATDNDSNRFALIERGLGIERNARGSNYRQSQRQSAPEVFHFIVTPPSWRHTTTPSPVLSRKFQISF